MDLMESDLFKPPMILLQTVMEEVRHRSLPLYNRLKALIRAEDKYIWVFYNEYRSLVATTFVKFRDVTFVTGRLPSYAKRMSRQMTGTTVVCSVSMSSSTLVPDERVLRDSHGHCVVQHPSIPFPSCRTGTVVETIAHRRLTLR